MMGEVLSPSVKHSEESDLRAEMPGIGRDGPQGLGGRAEQDIVYRAGILEGNRGNLAGNGEHDMEMLRVEKLRPPGLNPFRPRERLALGAAARPAAVVGDPLLAAAVTLFDMAAVRGRSGSARWRSSLRAVPSTASSSTALARPHRSGGIYPPPPDPNDPRARLQK